MKIRSLALVLAAAACGHRYDAEDVASDADAGGSADASAETSNGPSSDAGADIPEPVDAEVAARTCTATPPTADGLCVDFDGDDVGVAWTKTTPDGGGPMIIDSAYASPPHALYDKSTGSNPRFVTWHTSGAKAVAKFEVEVKVNPYLVQLAESWNGAIEIVNIRNAQVSFELSLRAGGKLDASWSYVAGAAMGGAFPNMPSIPTNQWTTFRFQSSSDGGSQPAFYVNDTLIGSTTFGSWSDTNLDVQLGTYPLGQTLSKEIRFDDLRVSVTRK